MCIRLQGMASPHSTSAYDHLIKILLVGDAGTNKRALLAKYIGDEDLSDATTLGELNECLTNKRLLLLFVVHHEGEMGVRERGERERERRIRIDREGERY